MNCLCDALTHLAEAISRDNFLIPWIRMKMQRPCHSRESGNPSSCTDHDKNSKVGQQPAILYLSRWKTGYLIYLVPFLSVIQPRKTLLKLIPYIVTCVSGTFYHHCIRSILFCVLLAQEEWGRFISLKYFSPKKREMWQWPWTIQEHLSYYIPWWVFPEQSLRFAFDRFVVDCPLTVRPPWENWWATLC